jgi:hypothetical protein
MTKIRNAITMALLIFILAGLYFALNRLTYHLLPLVLCPATHDC